MDDFGTGYSSIDTLSRLPFTALKIDQGIVGRMQQSAKDATIVESSIRLAHRLGLEIVAEGIETESAFLRLQAAGCSVGQGCWRGRPMPLDDLVALLRSGRRWPSGALGLVHMAMLDHLEWRKALVDALLSAEPGGHLPPPGALSRFDIEHTECRLGRWYCGQARELSDVAAFAALDGPHRALHSCAKRVVDASLRGVRFHDLVPEMRELTRHSTRIIGLLQELEHAVLERLAEGDRSRSGLQREVARDRARSQIGADVHPRDPLRVKWARIHDSPRVVLRSGSDRDGRERTRRWLRGWRLAASLDRALARQEGPRPRRAVGEALSVLAALAEMGAWPGRRDPASERQVEEVRRRWARIQRRARQAARS